MDSTTIVLANNYVGNAFSEVYDVWDKDVLIEQPEWVNLFAGIQTIIYALDDKSLSIHKNWMDNYKLLYDLVVFAKKYAKRIVLISTADLYGNNWDWDNQTSEDSTYLDMNNDYRLSKRIAERIVSDSPSSLVIRIKNPFDGRVDKDNAIYNGLFDDVVCGWQDSFTYLPDLVKCIRFLIENNHTGIYNVVQPQSASLAYLFKNVLQLPKYQNLSVDVETLINPLINTDLDNNVVRADVNATKIQKYIELMPLDAAVSLSWADMHKDIDKSLYNGSV